MLTKIKTLRAQYFKGLAIAFLGVIVLSFDAMFIQMADVNGFKAAFWRALFVAISTSILFLFKNKKNSFNALIEGGKPSLISGLLWGFSGVSFALGILTAGSSTTLVMISLAPLFAAAFGLIAYKRIPSFVTLLATLGAIGGIWFMYRDGIGHLSFIAIISALAAPMFLGFNLAYMRNHQKMSRLALVMIGGYSGSLIALLAAGFNVAIDKSSLLPLFVLGMFFIPFGQVMISSGTRYIPAAESALINSLETVLGIFYVWLFIGEKPEADFIIGGFIVLLAITANSVYQARVRKIEQELISKEGS